MEKELQPQTILYVITKSNWGGAQKYVYELATNLDKEKWTAKVALGGNGSLNTKLYEAQIETIPLSGLVRDISFFKEWFVFISLWKLFRKEKPSVLHLNSSKIGGTGSFAARLAGVKKIVFTAHGWAFNEERKTLSRLLIILASWLTIIFSHKIIVLSEKEKEQVIKWPFIKNKLVVIHTGTKGQEYEPKNIARFSIASKYAVLQNHLKKIWIGNIAELHPNKGLLYAFEAMKKIENAIYVVIGEGEIFEILQKYINENDLKEKVFLVGKIENAAKYLKAFDILLFPSIKEGLPYFLLEAALAESVIIASDVGGVPEIIEQQKSGILVHPRQPKDIARAIEHLIASSDDREMFSKNLKKHVEKKFSFERMLKKTIKTYTK